MTLTLIQIHAILSVLLSFGVSTSTVNNVEAILMPKTVEIAQIATTTTSTVETTPQVNFTPLPVYITPVVDNSPIHFGSVIQSVPMGVFLEDITNQRSSFTKEGTIRWVKIVVKDVNGNIYSDSTKSVSMSVDGVNVRTGTNGNGEPSYTIPLDSKDPIHGDGVIYPITAHTGSVVEITFEDVVHSFTLDSI